MQNWHKRRRGCHFTGRVPLRSMACLLFRLRPIGQEIVVTHPRFRLITAVFGTLLALAVLSLWAPLPAIRGRKSSLAPTAI